MLVTDQSQSRPGPLVRLIDYSADFAKQTNQINERLLLLEGSYCVFLCFNCFCVLMHFNLWENCRDNICNIN